MAEILTRMQQAGLLDEPAARRVEGLVAEGKPLDEALLTASGLPEEQVLRCLAEEFHVPYVDLEAHAPEKEFLTQFPARILLERSLLPLGREDGVVTVASSRLFDTSGLDELRMASGLEIRLALAPSAEITRCIKGLLGVGADTLQSLVSEAEDEGVQVVDGESDDDMDLSAAAADASIIKFVNQVLAEAIERRATDVHVEPFEDALRVRYRVDGVLQEANIPPEVRQFHPAIVSRLKILSHLDIAEKRLPQDGRIRLKVAGREVDVRVSVIPMLHGEAVVLRLLDRGAMLLGLESLGMAKHDLAIFERVLALPHGIMLVTGPTGSGKTTTLYAALSRINDIARKIITIEDPIEYHLRGINQIQVAMKAGLTFARGLRSILRHDPDVILVGEIRDSETADIAVQASLTGHLVFSTLHTNDAPGALTRLVDMGIEPYLVASSLEAHHLPELQGILRSGRRGIAEEGTRRRRPRGVLPRAGLPRVPGHRLSRTLRHLRDDGSDLDDPRHDPRSLQRRRYPPLGGPKRHEKPAGRRLADGARRPHDDRRGPARHERRADGHERQRERRRGRRGHRRVGGRRHARPTR